MSEEISLRPVAGNDKKRWRELMSAYADFYKVEINGDALNATWSWIVDPHEPFWCTVAENSEGAIFGFTQYQLMHRSLSGAKVCYLSDLFVEPEQRGSGAGRLMIDHVFEFASERGISNVRWLTQDYNTTARKLYDSYGEKSDFILYSFAVSSN